MVIVVGIIWKIKLMFVVYVTSIFIILLLQLSSEHNYLVN